MSIKNQFPDGWWQWRSYIGSVVNQHHTDIQRIWRLLGLLFGPGSAPTGGDPWNPAPGTSGFGLHYEGFLADTLGASDSTGGTAGTATLNLWVVDAGTWTWMGDTITVTNRSPHLWLPQGHPLQCVKINGEYRPVIQYSPMYRAVLTEDLSGSGPATANLLENDSGSWVAYGTNISIDVRPSLSLGTNTMSSGKGINLQFTNGDFWIVSAEC